MLTIEHTNSISYITPFHITYMIWESIHTSHYSDIMMTVNHLTIIGNLSSIFKTNCPDFVVFYARCWSWCWASGLPSIQNCTVRDVINWIITEGSLWCHKEGFAKTAVCDVIRWPFAIATSYVAGQALLSVSFHCHRNLDDDLAHINSTKNINMIRAYKK